MDALLLVVVFGNLFFSVFGWSPYRKRLIFIPHR
jgi:hypothetical protein